jgi:hypothetical protein
MLSLTIHTSQAYAPDPECDHLTNPTPTNGETNVEITAKGVQTCITVTTPTDCTVNITFQWFDWHNFYNAWLAYREGTGPCPDYHDYEHNFSSWTNINTTTTLCAWNDNVTCYTEGHAPYFEWRVVTEYNCNDQNPETSECYYSFYPENCSIVYIHPATNSTNVCPCCDAMCANITNENGHPMNLTFHRNDSQTDNYYIVNQLINVTNGSYCFCIEGHNIKDIYHPMRFNSTYTWYVNVTDTVTDTSYDSDVFFFTTAEFVDDCPCGGDELVTYIREEGGCRGEIVSSPGFETLGIMTSLILIGLYLYKKRK